MSSPSNISTISELLTLSGCQYRLYDIGRRVTKLTKEQFEKIEHNQIPYPYPIQGAACIAIAFWQKSSSEPYLWFVKLPLDERGLLNQGARNHFIAIIIEALGADMTNTLSNDQEERLKQNPYHFTPAQYKLAYINSLLTIALKRPASQFYPNVKNYLSEGKWQQWSELGVQGIVDFSTRLDIKENIELLHNALPSLPTAVLSPFCSALENTSVDASLAEKLINMYQTSDNTEYKAITVRALSSSVTNTKVNDFFIKLIEDKTIECEILIVIAGRAWEVLEKTSSMMPFLETLLSKNDDALFANIFKDLVAIPLLRHTLFSCMRSPDRSPALSEAIGRLFNQVTH